MKNKLLLIYRKLHKEFGPRDWWPADTPFEVIVGAILTQNTAWTNVEKAIRNLKKAKCLNPKGLSELSNDRLAGLIRPAGYYNIKAKRLKNFLKVLQKEFGGSLKRLFKLPLKRLREKLLSINGIGPETADSILLYAGKKPIFVIDAYTKRVLLRHGMIDDGATYEQMQAIFMKHLPRSVKLFNEYHALIVELAKGYCRKRAHCTLCPLKGMK
ncbi:MAG: endonuclease III domain-containing protein [Candidatus Omnitrophica bacterium]|nr:endonuclease III domain-containing protein [Candidatus Omnitrophota bacterium]